MQFASGRISREFNGHVSQVQCRLVHILHPHSLIRVGYAITRAWVSGIGLLPVGERHRGGERREHLEEVDGASNEERRRGRTDRCKWAVREMAPNRLVCRWTHYLSHADSTDTLCWTLDRAHGIVPCTCITGNMSGRGRGRKLVM